MKERRKNHIHMTIFALFFTLVILGCSSAEPTASEPISEPASSEEVVEVVSEEVSEPEEVVVPQDVIIEEDASIVGADSQEEETEEVSEVVEVYVPTMGESNALRSAESYLAFTSFSYTGLIGQLEFEGYTHEEAVYAADHCGADWNEQAAESAKTYLDFMSFSKEGLIEQLEYDGFTHEQAVYGVEANGY